ncbi:hypothetical protein [Streptomyces sp. NPDC060031]|uniref:hypothetical protein n=1 Tax=Streptomyces sp. NPDC060031 TaxID=3347043 RepID=UPI003691A82A
MGKTGSTIGASVAGTLLVPLAVAYRPGRLRTRTGREPAVRAGKSLTGPDGDNPCTRAR